MNLWFDVGDKWAPIGTEYYKLDGRTTIWDADVMGNLDWLGAYNMIHDHLHDELALWEP